MRAKAKAPKKKSRFVWELSGTCPHAAMLPIKTWDVDSAIPDKTIAKEIAAEVRQLIVGGYDEIKLECRFRYSR